MLHRPRLAAALVCAALALVPTTARAQEPTPPAPSDPQAGPPASQDLVAEATAHRKAGDQAMEGLRYTDALGSYSAAYAITNDAALLYNMGRALQALGRFPEALDKLEAFEAAADAELKSRVPRLPKLMADLRQRVATLTVRTNVDGARVLVRSTVIGRSPLPGPVRLTAGSAEVEVEAEGHFPARRTVQLPGGSDVAVDLDLFSRETTGVLSVRASATGAEVFVDGRRLGIAPVDANLAKGSHAVVVRHPDYRVYETSVVVQPGGQKTVTAQLEKSAIVTRWWFWGGVGAVVTAGVVLTIAAVTERPADSGTIAPGQLRTSGRDARPAGAMRVPQLRF
jgi:hypothetical protein